VLTTFLNSGSFPFPDALKPYIRDGEVQFEAVYSEAMKHAELLKPMMADVSRELNEANLHGANLLFEGAQGTLLDVDHGTYPYVTSSNCVAGNAAAGSGVGPGMLHYILGITKAYCTRVGGGPFPTELEWEKEGTPGWHMSTVGAEKGVTTGRSRRCGWFDAALLKRSAQVNGLSGLCITKLDVLDGLKELKLCTGYELDGESDRYPAHGCGRDCALPTDLRNDRRLDRQHGWRHPVRQAAGQRAPVPAAHRTGDRGADSHRLHQPGPRSHHHDAPPLPPGLSSPYIL
jgi:adenylosuccinate synthase